jgi:hypothetical protein
MMERAHNSLSVNKHWARISRRRLTIFCHGVSDGEFDKPGVAAIARAAAARDTVG